MNEKINPDLKSLKFIFNRNRSYIIPASIIFVCIILFVQFIVPQFGALLKAGKDGKEAALRVETLKENLNILSNINEDTLDSQLRVLSLALPLEKDFGGILNSIYYASQKTGANLGRFAFAVGDLSVSESGDNFPTIEVSIPVNSDVLIVNNFVDAMSKTFPLSEVRSISVNNVSSTVNLRFYYKPLGVSTYNQNEKKSPISQRGISFVNELTAFGNTLSSVPESLPVFAPDLTPGATPSSSVE